jgi:glycosyltransferase involved in cell wall biosynthesis
MTQPIVMVAGNDIVGNAGGHPSYVRAHARAALHAGFEPHLFSLGQLSGTVETAFGIVHHVPVTIDAARVPILRHRRNQLVWRYPVLARAVAAFILSQPTVRLIHSFGVFGCVGVMAHDMLRGHQRHSIPVMSSYDTAMREITAKVVGLSRAHGPVQQLVHRLELTWARTMIAPRERIGYLRSRLVFVNYESVRQLLIASFGIADRVQRLPYSSEMAFGRMSTGSEAAPPPDGVPPGDAPLILAISRHDARKGVDVLLRALGRLKSVGVPFRACLVGGGALLAEHRRLAAQLELGATTAITGRVADAHAYLAGADIFVLPSLSEGSGSLSLLEALQAGVASVASAVDGIPEDVTDNDTALLVPPADPEALAQAIGRLLSDAALRETIAARGRQAFEARFSAGRFSAALAQTYAGLGIAP